MTAAAPSPERRVRLFRNGRSQAVRIPREFELPGHEAVMRREGAKLILELPQRMTMQEVFEQLRTDGDIEDEWPEIHDPPPQPVDVARV